MKVKRCKALPRYKANPSLTMGAVCSTSNSTVSLQSERRGSDEESLGIVGTVTSTGGLQILLQQSHLRDSFRKFVSTQWSPSDRNSDFQGYSQTNPRKISLNCVDFWTDAQDFSCMQPSPYQEYRANHIYEKYIMHGCNHPVRALFTKLHEYQTHYTSESSCISISSAHN